MSKIEWTERTWNPVVGCSIVSPGCTNCYAMRMAQRIERMGSAPHYRGLTKVVKGNPLWTGKLAMAPEHILMEPLRVKRPTMWFVNSMSDLFHEDVPAEWIDRVFGVMAMAPQHTFQVLTKRSARMRAYMAAYVAGGRMRVALPQQVPPNVWLGVSAERQQEADERVPDLLATPAAIRFVSAEPLLGPITFWGDNGEGLLRGPGVVVSGGITASTPDSPPEGYDDSYAGLDWVIVGGESGPSARPFDLEWARSIVAQCHFVGVACFVKQVGSNPTDSNRPGLQGKRLITKSKKGGDILEWPPELRVRQMPSQIKSAEAA